MAGYTVTVDRGEYDLEATVADLDGAVMDLSNYCARHGLMMTVFTRSEDGSRSTGNLYERDILVGIWTIKAVS